MTFLVVIIEQIKYRYRKLQSDRAEFLKKRNSLVRAEIVQTGPNMRFLEMFSHIAHYFFFFLLPFMKLKGNRLHLFTTTIYLGIYLILDYLEVNGKKSEVLCLTPVTLIIFC